MTFADGKKEPTQYENYKILVIDDNQDIHNDFKKILIKKKEKEDLEEMESKLFDKDERPSALPNFTVHFANQGQEGLEKILEAKKSNEPYALLFVDIRMPPGWDGVETVERIWKEAPDAEVVFCSAYSDFSLTDIYDKLIYKDQFLIIKKPFDVIEIRQAAFSMCQKWNLKKKLEARIQDIQNKLLEADKMASIGQLAAGVAHEINNPVGYINSNISTLHTYIEDLLSLINLYTESEQHLDAKSDSVQKLNERKTKIDLDYLKTDIISLINESSEGIDRVKKIVQSLKDFSHESVQEWATYDLNAGIDSTLNIVHNEIKYKAEVIKEYGNLPEIQACGSKLNQVILNILVNASHAIEEKGTITIRTGLTQDKVWFKIQDSGKGIEPQNLKKIFEPFFTTKPIGKGTGLGLSLSYGIIQQHNGTIEVESIVNQGTTFTVTLPINQTQVLQQAG